MLKLLNLTAFLKISIFFLLLSFSQIAFASESIDSCRSNAGGYCVNLAAVAQAQGAQNSLQFLGNPQNIGDLVANLYYFGLGIVAVAAFIMMVLGGFTYMTAGDNPGRIKEGTDYIKNAIFGLLLALISWLILFTINPDLVRSLNLAIPKIELRSTTPSGACPSGQIYCQAQNACTTAAACGNPILGTNCQGGNLVVCVQGTSCPSGYNPVGQCSGPFFRP